LNLKAHINKNKFIKIDIIFGVKTVDLARNNRTAAKNRICSIITA
jgi:hypothetical protein